MVDEQIFAYIGRKSCGCVICCAVDQPELKSMVAKALGKWVRAGLAVERLPLEKAKELLTFDCDHK